MLTVQFLAIVELEQSELAANFPGLAGCATIVYSG